jgi:hypothetical protein
VNSTIGSLKAGRMCCAVNSRSCSRQGAPGAAIHSVIFGAWPLGSIRLHNHHRVFQRSDATNCDRDHITGFESKIVRRNDPGPG